MNVLLIRLKGPMQSWGSRSRFSLRTTEPYPTKSGVIGMIAAALGMARTEPLDRFRGLRFGVRVDQPGLLLDDFHTAHNDAGESMPLSHRHYLSDAVFLAALEDPDGDTRLREYADALAAPHFPLFLGRRSCPPDGPIATWIVDGSLEDALRSAPGRRPSSTNAVACGTPGASRIGWRRRSSWNPPTPRRTTRTRSS